MISPIAPTQTAPSAESACDTPQENKPSKKVSKSIGFQTRLFLMTAPANSLFRWRKHSINTYASLQHFEKHKLRARVAKDLSKAVILALKAPATYSPPFQLSYFYCFPNQYFLCDCYNKVVTDIYSEDARSIVVAARLLNISAGRKLIVKFKSGTTTDVVMLI